MNAASQLLSALQKRGISLPVENATERGVSGAVVPCKRLWATGPNAFLVWEMIRGRRDEVIALLEARGAFEANFARDSEAREGEFAAPKSLRSRMKKEAT